MRRTIKGLVTFLALGIMLGAGATIAQSMRPSTVTTPSIPLPPPSGGQFGKTA